MFVAPLVRQRRSSGGNRTALFVGVGILALAVAGAGFWLSQKPQQTTPLYGQSSAPAVTTAALPPQAAAPLRIITPSAQAPAPAPRALAQARPASRATPAATPARETSPSVLDQAINASASVPQMTLEPLPSFEPVQIDPATPPLLPESSDQPAAQ